MLLVQKTHTILSNIRFKTEINRHLVNRIFWRLNQLILSLFQFGCCNYLGFGFSTRDRNALKYVSKSLERPRATALTIDSVRGNGAFHRNLSPQQPSFVLKVSLHCLRQVAGRGRSVPHTDGETMTVCLKKKASLIKVIHLK